MAVAFFELQQNLMIVQRSSGSEFLSRPPLTLEEEIASVTSEINLHHATPAGIRLLRKSDANSSNISNCPGEP